MTLKVLPFALSICKLPPQGSLPLHSDFFFLGKTDEELSLVCPTEDVPAEFLDRSDGWRSFRIEGTLDFSLIGILSKITSILADHGIGIFAVSTFNTDYILVKQEHLECAMSALKRAGYEVI
ncbi:MAG: ACT domain-containing protein [Clostridia bacterium]|nr:ACT domain-containing protein [Clostridia bacterium]